VTTLDELQQLIAQKENARVEFKREVLDSVLQGMSTIIAAMSYAHGGVIIFGVIGVDLYASYWLFAHPA
jgi:predicted HTH transcriptional regulator